MIKNTLQEKIQSAMKSGDSTRVSTLRLLFSALHNEQIAKMRELTQDEELVIIRRQLKQREEAVEAYEKAGRTDSAAQEKQEAEILREFLPQQMSGEEIERIVDGILADNPGADFGQTMGMVMKEVGGKADGKLVSAVVREKLVGI